MIVYYRYGWDNKEVHYILEKEDARNDLFKNFIYEDVIPLLTYVYKTKHFRLLEESAKDIKDFLRRKFEQEKSTFDRSK